MITSPSSTDMRKMTRLSTATQVILQAEALVYMGMATVIVMLF